MIERDREVGMPVAEYVAATAAVVSPLEETEGLLADGSVADYGVRVGLPVLFRGRSGHFREVYVLDYLVFHDVIGPFLVLRVSS